MYAMLQSSMKELKIDESLVARNKNPWWKKVVIGVDITVATLSVAALVMFGLSIFVFDKKEQPKGEEVAA